MKIVTMECTFNLLAEKDKKEILEMSEYKELESGTKYLITEK